MLKPVALPCIRAIRNATFQQDDAQRILLILFRPFFCAEKIRLLHWPARSPDFSPIESIWPTVANRLARHHTLITIVQTVVSC